ncbi:hypothetical protein [Rickettsiella endosymbiont of Dermanyssus gallinae]|nr:hypothetical protein [Rickettsiella endosymbiont of Dermanyssus gallinae]
MFKLIEVTKRKFLNRLNFLVEPTNEGQVSRYAPEEFRPSCPRNSFA